ncbi:helix-turn-helix transcriptional regulator [Amycolatopsis taiwanensis]|uniref:helix-turn-helix transcriptional regulator n=1 Tax=Amycolatopsis taiwanensis TaxID=342230 RepID=UPI00047F1489|nr:helix-turn-helix transcriptional regulator [Amycolatopsis taiwanensis]
MAQTRALTCEAIDIALSDAPAKEKRLRLGGVLCRMLGADIFVSYVCDSSGPYADPIQINLSDDMLRAYDRRFRHVDDLTPKLFARRRTSTVTPAGRASEEFVHDFLHRSDMYHGMNYFPAAAAPGSVDLRLWRGRGSASFTAEDARVLQSFGDLIVRLWPRENPAERGPLTPRETQIAELVAAGQSDKEIISALDISLPTLRTHLRHAFAKTGAPNRAALAAHYLRQRY